MNAFYTTGQMTVKDWYWDQEANTLMAGTRTPLRLRMEITHAWGQPILHLLVVGKTFKALSYGERKLYIGDLNPGALSKFFPADLDADLIWEVLRGFPKLRPDGRMESRKADQVSLLGQNGDEMEILELDPESGLPRRISFPERKVAVDYADFQQEDGILYAKEVRVTQLGGTRNLTLKNGKMVFNKPIPDEIFRMEMPPGFETAYIEKTNWMLAVEVWFHKVLQIRTRISSKKLRFKARNPRSETYSPVRRDDDWDEVNAVDGRFSNLR